MAAWLDQQAPTNPQSPAKTTLSFQATDFGDDLLRDIMVAVTNILSLKNCVTRTKWGHNEEARSLQKDPEASQGCLGGSMD